MNLSFAGCGFLGIYHVGVAVCFKKYAPQSVLYHISGASAGAIAACSLLCDLPIEKMVSDTLNLMQDARMSALGPFRPSFQIQDVLWKQLSQVLPEDAHLRVNGKLRISLTRVYDGKNVIVSQFDSKEDLLQALLASCFVPIFSGFVPPKFHGERYMDGGFSDNLPRFDENTITVSPFCGESDICPRDVAAQLFHINVANTSIAFSTQNIFRFARILYPPKPEVLSNMCKQGFEDALRFLQRNNLINCTRCLAVQSTFLISDSSDDSPSSNYDPQCQECQEHRQEATVAMLPDMLVTIFQEYIDSANKGLYNWLLSHRSMKLISLLGLPYVIPAEIALELCRKLNAVIHYMSASLKSMCAFLILQMMEILETVSSRTGCNLTPNLQSDYEIDEPLEKDINVSFTVYGKDFDVDHYASSLLALPWYLSDPLGDDTFENNLQVTSHYETIMVYYYREEYNKLKFTKIFDVTESELSAQGMTLDRVSSWVEQNEDTFSMTNEISSTCSAEDDQEDNPNIFSDPESEWTMGNQNLRPESDQEAISDQ